MISKVYGLAVCFRNFLFNKEVFRIYHSKLPVVSVGNISVGGTGKTPFVIFLVELLKQRGFSPCVLTRGYGGSLIGPIQVSSQGYEEVGDEPLIIAQYAPVVVAKKRVQGAKFIEEQSLGNVIILDDGFQHRYLARTKDIVLLNSTDKRYVDDVLQNSLLPTGSLREPVQSLKRASCFVLSERGKKDDSLKEKLLTILPKDIPVFFSSVKLNKISNGKRSLTPCEVIVLSTIASPGGFYTLLNENGFIIKEKIELKDHAVVSRDFLMKVLDKNISVVVTEKDIVKIPDDIKDRFFVCLVSAVMDNQDGLLDFLGLGNK